MNRRCVEDTPVAAASTTKFVNKSLFTAVDLIISLSLTEQALESDKSLCDLHFAIRPWENVKLLQSKQFITLFPSRLIYYRTLV